MIAGQLEIQLLADVARIKKDMDAATKTVTGAMQSIDKAVGFANKALGILGVGVGINTFAGLVKSSIDAADHLNDLSKTTGISVRDLSGLKLAAKQTGGELDSTAKAISMLTKRMGEDGEKFRKLGIDARDPIGALKQVADQFNAIQDPMQRAAFGAQAFGKSWESVAPLLSEGSTNIQAMIDKGARLSGVTQDMASSADEFNDNLELLSASTSGWATSITNSLLPALISTSEWMLKIIDHQTWLEARTAKATLEIQDQAKALASMPMQEVTGKAVEASYKIQELQERIAELNRLGTWGGFTEKMTDEIATLTAQLAAQNDLFTQAKARMAELSSASGKASESFVGQAKVLKDLEAIYSGAGASYVDYLNALVIGNERHKVAASNIEFLNGLYARSADNIVDSAEAYVELMRASGAALPPMISDVKDLDAVLNRTSRSTRQFAAETSKATADALADWRLFRDSLGNLFADTILDPSGNFFDKLGDSFKRLFAKTAGDLAATGLVSAISGNFSVAGTLASAGTSGSMVSAMLGKVAPSLAGSLGIGGSSITAAQAAALNLPASAAGGAGLMSTLGAIAPWIAGAAALAAVFDKKSTPSWNSGFLLQDVPGAKPDQTFSTAAFASGLNPVGFTRRTSQAEAEQTIELFRQLDKLIVDTAALGGYKVNPSALMGYSETGLGSGVFFGGAGEKGKPGTALEQQMQAFATQLIGSLRGQLDDAVLNDILSGGSVDAMLAKLKETLNLQNEAVSAQETLAKQQAEALAAQEAALDRFQVALGATRDYIDGIAQAQRDALTEQRRVIEDSYREQMRAEEDLHNRRVALFRSLQDAINGFRLGDLTTLNPRDQLSLAQANFRSLATAANNTNLSMADRVAAAEQLQGASQSYLQAGRSFYASSGGYKDIFSEVLSTLEGARFLGTNQAFNATPYENAMLDEMKKLNESVLKLQDGFASRLSAMMFSLISQGRMAGLTDTQIANSIRNQGSSAVAAADQTGLFPGGVAGAATSDADIVAQIRWALANNGEEAAVRLLASQAKGQNISADYLGGVVSSAFGVSSGRVGDLLAKYGISSFAVGTNYVPQDMLANVHRGERIIPAADNATLIQDNKRLVDAVEKLTAEVVTLRQWQQTADQAKVNKLADIAESNKGMANKMEMASNAKVGSAAA